MVTSKVEFPVAKWLLTPVVAAPETIDVRLLSPTFGQTLPKPDP